MESYLFASPENCGSRCEGLHEPDSLVRLSGVWIHAAGSASLGVGRHALKAHEQWVWMAVEEGEAVLAWGRSSLRLAADEMCFLPSGGHAAALEVQSGARCLWIALEGEHASLAVRRLGAPLRHPLRQRAMHSQMVLAKQIAQTAARYDGTDGATYQLQQLLYGMLSSHYGLPVAVEVTLSREVARVVDAMRANRYRDNLSLDEMAQIAGLPTETFRKRFVSEIGMPPLRYAMHYKMERAKDLLLEPGSTVAGVGAAVGIGDPYRFSKLFKSIVGMPPLTFARQAALVHEAGAPRGAAPAKKG